MQFERVENELAQIHVGNNACYFCNTLLVPRYIFFFSEEERSQFASSCFLLIIAVPEKCVSRKCFWVSLNGHSVNLHVIAISPSEQLGKKHAELKEGNVDTVQYCVPHTWALYVGYYHFKWFCFSQRSGHWFTYDKGDKDNKEEEEEF